MNNKWRNDLLKAVFTLVFVFISYFLTTLLNFAAFIPFIPLKSQFPLGVATYTAIFNLCLFFYLSYRTTVKVTVMDYRDKSNKIKLDKKPRKISIKVEIIGNSENVKGSLLILFPDWIDVTKTKDPDIETVNQKVYRYKLNRSSSSYTCHFDINLNEFYTQAIRESEIKVKFTANKFRYGKELNSLIIHNQ